MREALTRITSMAAARQEASPVGARVLTYCNSVTIRFLDINETACGVSLLCPFRVTPGLQARILKKQC